MAFPTPLVFTWWIALKLLLFLSPKLWRLCTEMQRVPCATSPSASRTSCITTVHLRVAQMICHGAPPHQIMTKTRNMASVQVNVRLINCSIRETRENICSGAVKSTGYDYHPDSSLHIWRKRQWREMCLPLHFHGEGIWQLYHNGPYGWSPLVCHYRELWPGQEIWLLSQQRCVWQGRELTIASECVKADLSLLIFVTLNRYDCYRWEFRRRALPLPLRVPRQRVWFLHQWG